MTLQEQLESFNKYTSFQSLSDMDATQEQIEFIVGDWADYAYSFSGIEVDLEKLKENVIGEVLTCWARDNNCLA